VIKVYTVFGVAPCDAAKILASEASPNTNKRDREKLHWTTTEVPADAVWPDEELNDTVGLVRVRLDFYGDDAGTAFLEVSGLDLDKAGERWRTVAKALPFERIWG
jgi:hypothetical protein